MAETPLKRLREETLESELSSETLNQKRQKYSYNDILSLLESEEEEQTEDLTSLITTLQHELSSEFGSDPTRTEETDPETTYDDDDDKESVMRHLLEASDDELGIPNREDDAACSGSGENEFAMVEGLWELEDEAANYYTLLQSELFM